MHLKRVLNKKKIGVNISLKKTIQVSSERGKVLTSLSKKNNTKQNKITHLHTNLY